MYNYSINVLFFFILDNNDLSYSLSYMYFTCINSIANTLLYLFDELISLTNNNVLNQISNQYISNLFL